MYRCIDILIYFRLANVKSYLYLSRFMMFVLMLINIFFCLLIFNVRVDLYMHLMIWIKWFLYTHNNFEYFCSVYTIYVLYCTKSQDRNVFIPTIKNSWSYCKWIYVHFTIIYAEPKNSKVPLIEGCLALK